MALGIAKDIRFIDGARITGLPTSIANGQPVVHEQFVPGGSDTQIQFNDEGVFAGHPYLTIDKVLGKVFVGPVADDSLNSASCLVISGQEVGVGSDGGQDITQIYAGTSNPGWIVYPSKGTLATPLATDIGDWLYNFAVYAYPFGTISAGFLIVQDGATDANGASASFEIQTNNDTRVKITNNATIFSNDVIFSADNTDDIGASGATRPRTGYFGTSVLAPAFNFSSTVINTSGTGSPEGIVTGAVGSTFHRTDGGASTVFYVKESGTGNTGWIAYGVGGSGAPSTATYITQTADAGLSAEQALGSLATGLLKNTTTTGVLSIAGASDLPSAIDATKIADGSVSNAEFQFINSLSSNVQTQIDGKLSIATNLSDLANVVTARTNLGLGSVDNTSDAGKPVSTAQQTALNLKANLAGPVFGSAGIGISGSTSGTTTVTTDPVAGSAVVVIPATVSARLPVVLYATNATTEGNAATQADTTGTGGNQNTASGTAGTSELIFKSQYSLPANYLTTNKVIRITGIFQFTSSSSPPTSTLKLKFGGTNLASSAAFNIAASVTRGLSITWFIQGTEAAGSSVSIEAGNLVQLNAGGVVTNSISTPVAAINTSIVNVISLSWQWAAATAGNNVILKQLIIEALN